MKEGVREREEGGTKGLMPPLRHSCCGNYLRNGIVEAIRDHFRRLLGQYIGTRGGVDERRGGWWVGEWVMEVEEEVVVVGKWEKGIKDERKLAR